MHPNNHELSWVWLNCLSHIALCSRSQSIGNGDWLSYLQGFLKDSCNCISPAGTEIGWVQWIFLVNQFHKMCKVILKNPQLFIDLNIT